MMSLSCPELYFLFLKIPLVQFSCGKCWFSCRWKHDVKTSRNTTLLIFFAIEHNPMHVTWTFIIDLPSYSVIVLSINSVIIVLSSNDVLVLSHCPVCPYTALRGQTEQRLRRRIDAACVGAGGRDGDRPDMSYSGSEEDEFAVFGRPTTGGCDGNGNDTPTVGRRRLHSARSSSILGLMVQTIAPFYSHNATLEWTRACLLITLVR